MIVVVVVAAIVTASRALLLSSDRLPLTFVLLLAHRSSRLILCASAILLDHTEALPPSLNMAAPDTRCYPAIADAGVGIPFCGRIHSNRQYPGLVVGCIRSSFFDFQQPSSILLSPGFDRASARVDDLEAAGLE